MTCVIKHCFQWGFQNLYHCQIYVSMAMILLCVIPQHYSKRFHRWFWTLFLYCRRGFLKIGFIERPIGDFCPYSVEPYDTQGYSKYNVVYMTGGQNQIIITANAICSKVFFQLLFKEQTFTPIMRRIQTKRKILFSPSS